MEKVTEEVLEAQRNAAGENEADRLQEQMFLDAVNSGTPTHAPSKEEFEKAALATGRF